MNSFLFMSWIAIQLIAHYKGLLATMSILNCTCTESSVALTQVYREKGLQLAPHSIFLTWGGTGKLSWETSVYQWLYVNLIAEQMVHFRLGGAWRWGMYAFVLILIWPANPWEAWNSQCHYNPNPLGQPHIKCAMFLQWLKSRRETLHNRSPNPADWKQVFSVQCRLFQPWYWDNLTELAYNYLNCYDIQYTYSTIRPWLLLENFSCWQMPNILVNGKKQLQNLCISNSMRDQKQIYLFILNILSV